MTTVHCHVQEPPEQSGYEAAMIGIRKSVCKSHKLRTQLNVQAQVALEVNLRLVTERSEIDVNEIIVRTEGGSGATRSLAN